jgi:dolichol-phosphate mannosyltransferase
VPGCGGSGGRRRRPRGRRWPDVEKLVIIPTYNERENIVTLLDRLMALPYGLHVLVVDDGSPDGTAALVQEYMVREPRVQLLQRPGKLGLGSAYRDGFRFALDHGAEYIFEMDADFSHDPAAIGDFLRNADEVDVVLGSRYLGGKVTVVNWPLNRLFLSYGANLYTRLVTGMPLYDATGGFKCFRRRALEGIRLDRVQSDGYAFQIELSYKCWKRGFRIREIPIVFVDRRAGVSKMSRRIIWEAAGVVWHLRFMDLLGRSD